MSKYDNVWDQAHRSLWKVTHNHFFKGLVVGLIVVTMSFWMFKTLSVLVCPAKHRLSRSPSNSRRGRARATPAPHSRARELRGAAAELSDRGGVERCLPVDGLLAPRQGGGIFVVKGVSNILEVFPSRICFSCPLFYVSICMEGIFFFRDGALSRPPDSLSLFGDKDEVFNSVRVCPGLRFDSHILTFFISLIARALV